MPDRKSLVYTSWLLTSLVLLVWVSITPPRKSGVVVPSSRRDSHRNESSLHQAESTPYLRAAMDADAAPEGASLAWEEEEQDRVDALDEPRESFLVACSFRKAPTRQVISSRSILSHYPIRC